MKKTIAVVLTLVLCLGVLAGCGSKKAEDKTITVAASPTPHAEILKVAADVLAKDGYTLSISTPKTSYKNTSGLKKGTRYYFKVRAYKQIGEKRIYSGWSNITYKKSK